MEKKLKSWQGWLLFGGTMIVVFVLGVLAASINERRAEIASVINNKKVEIKGIEAVNEKFAPNYPREYETWTQTADTSFRSQFNGNQMVDVLEARPEMVILWAGYAFSKDYSTPRGHMHAIEDMRHTLRVGSPMTPDEGPQPATCWTCKSPDVPRMMQAIGVDNFYKGKWASMGTEIVNPIGCADCHEPENMNLHISRPALIEAFQRQGRDINKGTVDVVVCDGFVGNVVLKFGEGLAKAIMTLIKEAIMNGGILAKLGGLLIKPALKGLKKRLDPAEYGGALLLGIRAPFIICHGSSKAKAITNAIHVAMDFAEQDVVSIIKDKIAESKEMRN